MQIGGTRPSRGAPQRTAPLTSVGPTRWPVAAALVVAATLMLGACTTANPTASPSATTTSTTPAATSATTATTSPTLSATSPSPANNTLAKRFPETKAGAEAFVTYLHQQLNSAYRRADASRLRELVDPVTCADCSDWLEIIADLKQQGQRYDSDLLKLLNKTATKQTNDTWLVIIQVEAQEIRLMDPQGRVIDVYNAESPKVVFLELTFTDHWRLTRSSVQS